LRTATHLFISAGWQLTLCDPIWHVSSRSGMSVPVAVWQPCELLYTCYLLTYSPSSGTRILLLDTKGAVLNVTQFLQSAYSVLWCAELNGRHACLRSGVYHDPRLYKTSSTICHIAALFSLIMPNSYRIQPSCVALRCDGSVNWTTQRWTWVRSIHVSVWGGLNWAGWVLYNDSIMGWVQRLRGMKTICKTWHFMSTTLN